jgi:glycosyltransferase involved in cell wall biosynthesis
VKLCFLSDARAEHTRRWTRFFALRGHETHLITWNTTHLDGYAPVILHVLKKPFASASLVPRIANLISLYRSARKIILNMRPDVIHAHSMGSYSWLAWAIGYRPYVLSPWGTDVLVDAVRSRANRWLTLRAARGSHRIVCDGRHIEERLAEWSISPKKIDCIPFGTDVDVFAPLPQGEIPPPVVPSWGQAPIVLSTRTLTPVHDVATFVRMIPLVRCLCPEARFVMVGGGGEQRTLEALVDQLGVREVVHFAGHLVEEEMVRYLRGSAVYVSSSLMDAGLAGSTAEAMACGLPVVTTDNADNALWVQEGEGGYLVPNGNSAHMAEKVVLLLHNSRLRYKMGQFNRRVIVEKNNTVVEMAKVESIYEGLIRENRRQL